ncbi:LPS export ABC transporter periplasmic protein LptC [Synechococcus sp. CS-197]|uniref:LPS export ABC transporter periplasmic protein LptC n=1 Tax=Synechococcus sp. CS-197 TaxID=2847985 RepID=UPI0001525BCA|nr:LPS export ABC transporter periplasmic protein LptC [Synechococcus sp. CS-197]MCT0251977.1 LPS export ABC transporter periplasmic protein LptC [Synechococcus sp. CS-197]CAK23553.1 Uncharacterized conserved secreted protein [Synechococcus sp. WH 7803]
MALPSRHGWLASCLLAGLPLLGGCADAEAPVALEAPPFVFRSLELEQKSSDGQRDWTLSSPEARYELNKRLVRARKPVGLLFRNGKPSFRIQSDLAQVINDGEKILLEGNVKLQQLTGAKLLIQGDRLRWRPEQGELTMEQRPRATDRESRISSRTAVLQQTTNELTLTGTVQLDRWSGADRTIPPDSSLRSGKAQWNLDSGQLKANGPVLGQRRDQEGTVLEQLEGQSLNGNTLKGEITVLSPVTLRIPREKGVLRAQATTWLFRKQVIRSAEPFEADLDRTRITGEGFRADLGDTTVDVEGACEIRQPGEVLKAERCRWNWSSEAVLAEGQVRVRRDENDQVTRATRLEGTVGKEGRISFTAPGSLVESEIRIPAEGRGGTPGSRRQPNPVSF